MRTPTRWAATVALGLGLALVPGPVLAQVGNPAPQALGMGENYTALARGLAAPAWNPAGLGMPDNPGWSLAVMPVMFNAGLSPIGPSDLAEWEGELIPAQTRIEWLHAIHEAGGEKGSLGGDLTYLAFSMGNFAFSASSNVRGRVNMAPDVAEVFFFGNAGLTGEPGDYTLEGSNFDIAGTSTVAASFGLPLSLTLGPLPDQHFSVGATVKYTMGNFLVLGQESQSSLLSDPLSVDIRFPMVHTPFPDDSIEDQSFSDVFDNGSGIGVDVGAAWQGGIFSAGVVVKNIINTFEWELEDLRYREGTAVFTTDTSYTDFDEAGVAPPTELVDRIETLYAFSPVLAAGAAAQVTPFLKVTGDVRHAVDETLDVGGRSHVGVGAELTVLPILPIRAGVSAISGGYQLSGGLGLKLGPVQLAASGAFRDTELGDDTKAAFAIMFNMP